MPKVIKCTQAVYSWHWMQCTGRQTLPDSSLEEQAVIAAHRMAQPKPTSGLG